MNILRPLFLTAVLLFPLAPSASTINFAYTGLGSGTISGVSFSANYTIFAAGDTDNRITVSPTIFKIVHTSAMIDIEGVGTFDFLTTTRTFVNNSTLKAGFSADVGGGDLLQVIDASFGTWDMLTSIGPTFGEGIALQWDLIGGMLTTGGALVLDDGFFDASFQATVVPLPAGLWLLLSSLISFGWVRKKNN